MEGDTTQKFVIWLDVQCSVVNKPKTLTVDSKARLLIELLGNKLTSRLEVGQNATTEGVKASRLRAVGEVTADNTQQERSIRC